MMGIGLRHGGLRGVMNTIRLRAWDKLDKKMYYHVGMTLYGVQVYVDDRFPEKILVERGKACMELMMCTGLTDKNGVDYIYEGDILDSEGKKIGNKYENPNLLESPTYLLIEGMGTKTWRDTEQKAMECGCFYAE